MDRDDIVTIAGTALGAVQVIACIVFPAYRQFFWDVATFPLSWIF